ncbi:MAG: glycosyltransferase family 39 protein, partial [Pseudomonadota bacterium]
MQSGPAADNNRIKIETPLWIWLALGLVCLAAALVRLHLLDVPFERDEGEYAYAGQLILQGVPPFALVYNMKLPGIYAAYALIMSVFGETIIGVRLGLLLINALTTLFFFLAFRRRLGSMVAFWGAAFFAVISLNPSVQGFMANAEHFVLVFAAAALWMLLRGL